MPVQESTPVADTPEAVPGKEAAKKQAAEKEPKKSFFDMFKLSFLQKKKPDDTAKTEAQEAREIEILIENFDPKRDRKKLTPKTRQMIKDAEVAYREGIITIKDMISPASMEVGVRDMKLNGQYIRTFFVFNYPRYLESNWLSPVINFDATMDISMFVYPSDSARMMKILRKKVTEMLSTKHMNERKGMVADVGLETALEDAEQLRRDLQKGEERFFHLGLYFTIYADSEEKLQTLTKQLETLLGGQLVMSRSADFQVERAFNSTLPQCTDELNVVRNMNTAPLSTTFPFVSSDLTSNEGILYGLNRHNNSLIIFDRFNLENANSVIFAKSGAGKSYTVKLEVLRYLMLGTDVIILDPENEYEVLTHTIGGSYIRISLTSPHRINPFDLPLPLDNEEYNTGELLRENIINLTGLLRLMLGAMSPEEEAILDKALMQTYEIKGITSDTENPYEYEMPIMADLKSVLDGVKGGGSLAIRLEKYTTGTYSGLFADQTNVDLGAGLVCFCIRDLEDSLRPISMYILLNYIWNKVRSKLKRRILVIDEAWNIVQHEDSGRFLHNLAKRARKYYLGISTITQDVEDFLRSPWGKPIITNSSMQILLKQAPSAIEGLKDVFFLTEGESYLLLNSGVGQGLFFAGNQHVALQVIASYGEHKIVTTNPEEILAMKKDRFETDENEPSGSDMKRMGN